MTFISLRFIKSIFIDLKDIGPFFFGLRYNLHTTKFLYFYFIVFFFCLFAKPQGMWDPSSPPEIEPTLPAVEEWSLNHWTTREGINFTVL